MPLRVALQAVAALCLGTLLIIGCGDDEVTNPPPEPTGSLAVTTTSIGSAVDADGYTVLLNGADSGVIGANDSVAVGVAVGEYDVGLSELADNCGVIGENPINATEASMMAVRSSTGSMICSVASSNGPRFSCRPHDRLAGTA